MACRKHNVTSASEYCQDKPNSLIDGITSPVVEAFVSGAVSASKSSGFLPRMLENTLSRILDN